MRRPTDQTLNRVADGILLVAGCAVATMNLPWQPGWHWVVFLCMSGLAVLLWTIGGRVLRHYDVWNGRGVGGDIVLTILLLGVVLGIMMVAHRLVPAYRAGSYFRRFFVIAAPGIVWLRLTVLWLQRREKPIEPVLIIGTGPLGRHTGLEILDRKDHVRVIGYLRFSDEPIHDRLPAEVLGTASDLEDVLKRLVVSEVFISGRTDSQRSEMQGAIRVLERFGIPFALPAGGFRFARARPEHENAVADGYIHYLSVKHKPVQLALKRLFDIGASASALALLSPLMLVVAVLIKVTSRGPVLFRQTRVGRHGRPFHMLKFRSMVANAEELKAKLMAKNEQAGPVFKIARDPRVTAVGRFIRKYSIDELPQLVNVLRGEMSVVGPRPPVPSEVARYEAWQRRRLSVRPGLTCVWQVSGRNEISFDDWMYLDMEYIDHWSLAHDFQLILKTVPIVLSGRGAS
ncbi:MAG TPA: sugar transferase [Polyangiaceae bacterium]|nr:sugar transferase [Polyangiaceae bacterium]